MINTYTHILIWPWEEKKRFSKKKISQFLWLENPRICGPELVPLKFVPSLMVCPPAKIYSIHPQAPKPNPQNGWDMQTAQKIVATIQ